MPGAVVTGWGIAVPDKVVTNADLEARLDTSDQWIVERTGIRERHIGGTTAELAVAAGRDALERAGCGGGDIDVLVLATSTPDALVPGTSATVQHALAVRGGAFDVNAACSGFVYALVSAHGLVLAGARRVLVIGSETLSNITDWDDRSLAVLVGDGAGAVVLEATDGPGELLAWDLGADGSLRHLLSCDHGGYLFMNGKEIFRHAVRVVVDSSRTVLARVGAGPEDVDLFIPHQANARIITAAGQRLGIPEDRWVVTIDRYGNTSSASIPLALYDALASGRLHRGDLVLVSGFGGGMTWASALLTMGRMSRSDPERARPALVVLAAGMAKRYGGCKPLAPVGLHGEAVIDLTAGDALAAGFGPVVLVLGPQTGPAIRYHVEAAFPHHVKVSFAEQTVPLGTAHAVLCARRLVGGGPFAVVNSDDVYGTPALTLLARHLAGGGEHAIVSYRLADTIVTDDPVTRGTCAVDGAGLLTRLVERRTVTRQPDGRFVSADGEDPAELDAATPVSMNLWGFQPSIWPVLEHAVRAAYPGVGPDGVVESADALDGDAEVLLPEVVGALIAGPDPQPVRVIPGAGRCIGVTHADDLPVVRNELALMVGRGLRPESPWHAAV